MTEDAQTDQAARAIVAVFALVGGVVVLRFVVDADWWLSVAMAVALGTFYLIPPDRPRGRLANAVSVAVLTGLGAWGLLDLGPWSLLIGLAVAALFVAYYRVLDLKAAGD